VVLTPMVPGSSARRNSGPEAIAVDVGLGVAERKSSPVNVALSATESAFVIERRQYEGNGFGRNPGLSEPRTLGGRFPSFGRAKPLRQPLTYPGR
jgi:hypothetical protein